MQGNYNQSRLPVNPKASPEAVSLLNFLYEIQGKKILSGQHNLLGRMSQTTDKIFEMTGKYPAVWGSDFGFSDDRNDVDNIKYRGRLFEEIQKQYERGSIIVLTYHQANPVEGEPCLFKPGVIYSLTDNQWNDLFDEGSEIYKKWKEMMELLAEFLKKVEALRIPIIFRPYHEMNGSWFWWGNRPGEHKGYQELWRNTYRFITEDCQIHNLLWSWCCDKPLEGFENYYPGDDLVDLLGADLYTSQDYPELFPENYYNKMKRLANTKPFALTENCHVIPDEKIASQKWLWFMFWDTLVLEKNSPEEIIRIMSHPDVISAPIKF